MIMVALAEMVDYFITTLLEYKKQDKATKDGTANSYNWTNVCKQMIGLMMKYPTGITEAVALSELLMSANGPSRSLFGSKKMVSAIMHGVKSQSEHNTIQISDILEVKQVSIDAVLECYIEDVSNLTGSQTKIVTLVHDRAVSLNINKPTIEMYLHQKIACYGDMLTSHPLRITSLRLHKVQNKGFDRLLPTEYIAPILNYDQNKIMIDSKFGTLEDIESEDNVPHYTRNLLLEINEIGQVETIHYPHGDSVHQVTIKLTDTDKRKIKLLLWDERVAFSNLLSPEDMLAVEEPFLVKEDGNFYIEHGPATLFYIIPRKISQELISTQTDKNEFACVKKTGDGKLDFASYPLRFVSQNVRKNSVNVSFIGVLEDISSKQRQFIDNHSAHVFQVTVKDEFGDITVEVFDGTFAIHDMVYPGQIVFLENLEINASSVGILKTWESGQMFNISGLKGYISSPCFYKLTDIHQFMDDGNYISVAKISKFEWSQSLKQFLVRVHSACLQPVRDSKTKGYSCIKCQCSSLEAELEGDLKKASKDVSRYWKWRYAVVACLIGDSGEELKCNVTEQFCQELFQIDSDRFASMGEKHQNSLMDKYLNKNFVFSYTIHQSIKLLNSCTADSF